MTDDQKRFRDWYNNATFSGGAMVEAAWLAATRIEREAIYEDERICNECASIVRARGESKEG